MEPLLVPLVIAPIAEIGDKTQLLALILSARTRQPSMIITAILPATLANHSLGGWCGADVTQALYANTMRWIVGGSLLAPATFAVLGSAARVGSTTAPKPACSVRLSSDSSSPRWVTTRIATAALAARYSSATWMVVIGSTLGLLLAGAPAVLLGGKLQGRLPVELMRTAGAMILALLASERSRRSERAPCPLDDVRCR